MNYSRHLRGIVCQQIENNNNIGYNQVQIKWWCLTKGSCMHEMFKEMFMVGPYSIKQIKKKRKNGPYKVSNCDACKTKLPRGVHMSNLFTFVDLTSDLAARIMEVMQI